MLYNIEKYKEDKKDSIICYILNLFMPSGRMKRLPYFVILLTISIISKILNSNAVAKTLEVSIFGSLFFIFILILLFIIDLFITKKRMYDITLSNKKSWLLSSIFIFTLSIFSYINYYIALFLIAPFRLYFLFTESNTSDDTMDNL